MTSSTPLGEKPGASLTKTGAIGRGFVIIAFVILAGQFIIVNFCGPAFNVEALSLQDWGIILLLTSPILIIPDMFRTIRNHFTY